MKSKTKEIMEETYETRLSAQDGASETFPGGVSLKTLDLCERGQKPAVPL